MSEKKGLIRQSGQVVVSGFEQHPLLSLASFSQVPNHLAEPDQTPRVIAQRGNGGVSPEQARVLFETPSLFCIAAVADSHFEVVLGIAGITNTGGIERGEMLANHFFGTAAGQPLRPRIPTNDEAIGVQHEDGVLKGRFNEETKPLLAERASVDVLV